MKASQHVTDHILVKAGCMSQWDCCDFAIIDCRRWKERIGQWLRWVEALGAPQELISLRFYDNNVDFYVSKNNEAELLSNWNGWTFVHLDEEEEESFDRPETRLEAASLVLYPDGSGLYKSYGKYTLEEFYTETIPLRELLKQMESRETLMVL